MGLVAFASAFPSNATAQVLIQSEAQSGGVYGQGSVYVQPQPGEPVVTQSPYTAAPEPQPRPSTTIVHRSFTNALLVPGVIALGAGWLIHGIASTYVYEQCNVYSPGSSCPAPADSWAGLGWIPIVGPWLAYGLTQQLGDYGWFNILFGVIQDVGTVLAFLGLVIQQEWEETIYADLGEGVRLSFAAGPTSVGASLTF
jgi:hypothetical protein